MFANSRSGRFLNAVSLEGPERGLRIVDHDSVGQIAESGPFYPSLILQGAVVSFPFGSLHWLLIGVGVLVLICTVGCFRSGCDGFLEHW